MSDDTPTQRFDAAADAPTEMLTSSPDPGAGPDPVAADAAPRSKRTLVILLAVGGALLLAVLILLIVLLLRGTGSPVLPTPTPTDTSASASPTPTETSATPTPTPTPTETVAPPPPPPPSPISSFTASQGSVNCDGVSSVTVQFSWATTGQTLWFGVGTDNAKAAPYDTFPLNYTLDFDYQCGQASGEQKYTITVEAAGGGLTSESIVIRE